MPKAEFKYHALRYLNLWVSQDRACCEALAGTDDSEKLRALAKAARFTELPGTFVRVMTRANSFHGTVRS